MLNIHARTTYLYNPVRAAYKATCSCGWQGKDTINPRKSWRQHVTRGTGPIS